MGGIFRGEKCAKIRSVTPNPFFQDFWVSVCPCTARVPSFFFLFRIFRLSEAGSPLLLSLETYVTWRLKAVKLSLAFHWPSTEPSYGPCVTPPPPHVWKKTCMIFPKHIFLNIFWPAHILPPSPPAPPTAGHEPQRVDATVDRKPHPTDGAGGRREVTVGPQSITQGQSHVVSLRNAAARPSVHPSLGNVPRGTGTAAKRRGLRCRRSEVRARVAPEAGDCRGVSVRHQPEAGTDYRDARAASRRGRGALVRLPHGRSGPFRCGCHWAEAEGERPQPTQRWRLGACTGSKVPPHPPPGPTPRASAVNTAAAPPAGCHRPPPLRPCGVGGSGGACQSSGLPTPNSPPPDPNSSV